MRQFCLLFAICTGVFRALGSESLEWFTDVQAAQAKAKAENKLVLLAFTGSDWCSWCKKLKREVFDKPEFAQFADSKLILVEVDFPQNKTLSRAQQQANAALQKAYHIRGYPTLILLDQGGKQVKRMGYAFGGSAAFIAKIEKVITAKSSGARKVT